MTRKEPTKDTCKKLFAFSGNQCAFEDCNNVIFDSKENYLAEICHIEAAEKGGQRYNELQDDEERRSYENLLILCRHHHAVTNDENEFTVKKMKEIKQNHEKQFLENQFQITDAQIEKAIAEFLQVQGNSQTGSGTQINTQTMSGVVNIQQGLSSEQTEHMITTIFEQNFPKLVQGAAEKAEENVKKFAKVFFEKASVKLTKEEQIKMSDPDIQKTLSNAINFNATHDDDDLREYLTNLMIQRIKKNEENLQKIVYNEAISTVEKITNSGLKIITLNFVLFAVRFHKVKDIKSFENFLNSLKPLMDFNNTESEFKLIQYSGCGTIQSLMEFKIFDVWRDNYSIIFHHPFTEKEVAELQLSKELTNKIIEESNGQYRIKIQSWNLLEDLLKKEAISKEIIDNVVQQYKNHLMSDKEVEDIVRAIPIGNEVLNILENSDLKLMDRTSVGTALALNYATQIMKSDLDVNNWIF